MPTLTLLADVAFIVIFEILDCVGQRLFEVGVFQPTFFPQSPTRRYQVAVRTAVGGIVGEKVGTDVGSFVGIHEGSNVGWKLGLKDGNDVGSDVGVHVGSDVG